MSNINLTTAVNNSKKYLDDIYYNYPNRQNLDQNLDQNSSYVTSVSFSYSNNNGESNIFSYGYSNINNTEKEMYYGGKFNQNNSREELGKSLNRGDFKVKRISNKNKQDESSYEFTKPYFFNDGNMIENKKETKKYQLSRSGSKSRNDFVNKNLSIKNIFNDPFFTDV